MAQHCYRNVLFITHKFIISSIFLEPGEWIQEECV